jgi:hypothetical protein
LCFHHPETMRRRSPLRCPSSPILPTPRSASHTNRDTMPVVRKYTCSGRSPAPSTIQSSGKETRFAMGRETLVVLHSSVASSWFCPWRVCADTGR